MQIGDAQFYSWTSAYRDGSSCVTDEVSKLEVVHIESIASFIQLMSYVKYKLNKEDKKVFYRGQAELYHEPNTEYQLLPSLYRSGSSRQRTIQNKKNKLFSKIKDFRETDLGHMKGFNRDVLEGVLQQYGINTTWLDAVDNIWVALWFACYKSDHPVSISLGKNDSRQYIHMIPREPKLEDYNRRYAYILILKGDDVNMPMS